jgi:hypothetical protein
MLDPFRHTFKLTARNLSRNFLTARLDFRHPAYTSSGGPGTDHGVSGSADDHVAAIGHT